MDERNRPDWLSHLIEQGLEDDLEGGNYQQRKIRRYALQLGEREIVFEVGKVANQASGAVTVSSGDTVVLVATTHADKPRPDIDFMPLTVDYEEKMYAIGKIPGGFIKKEGKPSDEAILKARMIDRSIRPLFPEGFFNDVNVYVVVMSADPNIPADILGLVGASAALSISPVPFEGPIGAVRVGLVNGEFIVNPTTEELESSVLDLVVASTRERVVMIEAGASEVPENVMMEAIKFAHQENQRIIDLIEIMMAEVGKAKLEYTPPQIPEVLEKQFDELYRDDIDRAVRLLEKSERASILDNITPEDMITKLQDRGLPQDELEVINKTLTENPILFTILKKRKLKDALRHLILIERTRPDGRRFDQIRPLYIEVKPLPRPHGSAMFVRGQTQVISTVTLGTVREQQMLETLSLDEEFKRFMHHYYFPPYSVGEARPMRGPSRREIGHGALAERALLPMIPPEEIFPYTIRAVSEVLESNGSTSMASTCGASLALMDAGVPIPKHVAGIAIGLMTDPNDIDNFVVLTDIQGLEDFFGEMDFKVAGTYDGITAIQMDTKLKGITFAIIEEALKYAKRARLYILRKMYEAIPEPRKELSPHAPRVLTIKVDPEKIADIIGSGGRVIRKITEDTDTEIDIKEDGTVFIYASNLEGAEKAKEIIDKITGIEKDKVYLGKVVRLADFGAFVEVAPGKIGLLHISQISDKFIRDIREHLKVGDEILVKILEVDATGRFTLTSKGLNEPETDGTHESHHPEESRKPTPPKRKREHLPPELRGFDPTKLIKRKHK